VIVIVFNLVPCRGNLHQVITVNTFCVVEVKKLFHFYKHFHWASHIITHIPEWSYETRCSNSGGSIVICNFVSIIGKLFQGLETAKTMWHQVKIWRRLESGFFWVELWEHELLPVDDILRILIHIWTKKPLSFTFTVSSYIHRVEIISKFRINFPMMSIYSGIVHKPMHKENGASVLRIIFSINGRISIILNLQVKVFTFNIWNFKLNWIHFRPLVLGMDHKSRVFFFFSFCKPFTRFSQNFRWPSIVDTFGSA